MDWGSEVDSDRDWQKGEGKKGSRKDMFLSPDAGFPSAGLGWPEAVSKGVNMLREASE